MEAGARLQSAAWDFHARGLREVQFGLAGSEGVDFYETLSAFTNQVPAGSKRPASSTAPSAIATTATEGVPAARGSDEPDPLEPTASARSSQETAETGEPDRKIVRLDPDSAEPRVIRVSYERSSWLTLGLTTGEEPLYQREGSSGKIYKCQFRDCEFTSGSQDMAYMHVRREHKNVVLECSMCSHSTPSARMLKQHVDRKHPALFQQ